MNHLSLINEFLELLLTISLATTGSNYSTSIYSRCLLSLLVTSLWCITSALQKPCHGNFRKFQGSGKSRFGGSERDRYFLKIPKWWHKLVRNDKRGKLVSYFLNNAAKTWLYGLKISENIEIDHFFWSKSFFHLASNLLTSCFSAFKHTSLLIILILGTTLLQSCPSMVIDQLQSPLIVPKAAKLILLLITSTFLYDPIVFSVYLIFETI